MMEAKGTSQPEGRPRPERNLGGSARDRTQGRVSLPAKLTQVNEAARRPRQTRFTALLHHVDDEALLRAFRRQRRAASAGVDGVTSPPWTNHHQPVPNSSRNITSGCSREEPSARKTHARICEGGAGQAAPLLDSQRFISEPFAPRVSRPRNAVVPSSPINLNCTRKVCHADVPPGSTLRIPMKPPGYTDLKPPGVPISKRPPFQSQTARDGVVS